MNQTQTILKSLKRHPEAVHYEGGGFGVTAAAIAQAAFAKYPQAVHAVQAVMDDPSQILWLVIDPDKELRRIIRTRTGRRVRAGASCGLFMPPSEAAKLVDGPYDTMTPRWALAPGVAGVARVILFISGGSLLLNIWVEGGETCIERVQEYPTTQPGGLA